MLGADAALVEKYRNEVIRINSMEDIYLVLSQMIEQVVECTGKSVPGEAR
jgi:hypothetical protein